MIPRQCFAMLTAKRVVTRDMQGIRFLVRLLLHVAAALSFASTAWATAPESDVISDWNARSDEARQLLASIEGTEFNEQISKLEEARAKLASQRDQALALSRTVPFEATVAQGKLELLGPIPEAGESEFAAAKRTEIEERLFNLTARQRAAQESYLRSAATIDLLDERIGDLATKELLERATSPLLPAAWIPFLTELPVGFETAFLGNVAQSSRELSARPALIIFAVVIGLVGLVVAFYLRSLVSRSLATRHETSAEGEIRRAAFAIMRDVAGLIVGLLGIAIVAAGALVFVLGSGQSGGLAGLVLAALVPMVVFHWLGTTIFAPNSPNLRIVDIGERGAKRATIFMFGLGAALGLETVAETIEGAYQFSGSAGGIFPFLIMTLVSFLLYKLARTIEAQRATAKNPKPQTEIAGPEDFVDQNIDWAKLITGAMKISAFASFLLAVVGYGALARFAVLPMIESLAVIALLTVIYFRLAAMLAALPRSNETEERNRFLAVRTLLAVGFVLLATPIIALFWGVRPAELIDVFVLLRDGITFGGTTISLGTVFVFFGAFAAGYVLTRWVQRVLQTMLLARLDIDEGTKSAIVTGIGYIGVVLAFIAAVGAAGIDLSNLAIIFGALSVGIGFGLQSIVSNFVSGIIMLIERPIKEGDSIEVGGHAGIVDKISVRATRIQSFDHDDVIIPNSELITGTVRNRTLTDRWTRIECSVGIAYNADVHKAFDILYEVAHGYERALADPAPNVVMEELGDSALMLRLYCFVDEVGIALSARSAMYVEIVRRFADAGISIPFPQRDIHLYGKTQQQTS